MSEQESLPRRIEAYRLARHYNSFDHAIRGASAQLMGGIGSQTDNPKWMQAARSEVIDALRTDPTDALLLLKGIFIDIKLKEFAEAKFLYEQFRRVDKPSPFLPQLNAFFDEAVLPLQPNPNGDGAKK